MSEKSETLAALDLGSNSFHLKLAKVENGHLHVVDRLREMVRLAAGLDEDNNLTPEASERALACLERFGQRLRHLPPENVRVVGTNTLRKAENSAEFLERAQNSLGHPIEIVAGHEEARLIYLGVAHSLVQSEGQRLVIDIGGGSTELIIGEGLEPQYLESIQAGCVRMTKRFFEDGKITADAMRSTRAAARLELRQCENHLKHVGWQQVVGASGTIRSVAKVLEASGWSKPGAISKAGMRKLWKTLLAVESIHALELPGLSEERKPVFPGGFAVLKALFEGLDIEEMQVSDGALREGLLYDLLGRIRHEDIRDDSISSVAKRYHVEQEQADKVAKTAVACLHEVADAWNLTKEFYEQSLGWAAQLHEIGLTISHSQYHKHSAYIAGHIDLPGFSQDEQRLLEALIRGHRRKFPQRVFKQLPKRLYLPAQRLCILLRLAVLVHRSRSPVPLPEFHLTAEPQHLHIKFPQGWLHDHPLTRDDLSQERNYLQNVGFLLSFE